MSLRDDILRRIEASDLTLPAPVDGAARPLTAPPDAPSCPNCGGCGWLSSGPVRGAWGDDAPKGLVPCPCREPELRRRRYQELVERSKLTGLLREKTFATFDPKVAGLSKAYGTSLRYSAQLRGWLILAGKVGVGKTHLAAAIGNVAIERDVPTYFAVIGELLGALKATFDRENTTITFEKLFDQIKEIPLLIMDDLGTENETSWAREQIFQILDWRYTRALPTVLTTNRTSDLIDRRITSRMGDMAFENTILAIDAADYRLRNMHGGWLPVDKPAAGEPKQARHA